MIFSSANGDELREVLAHAGPLGGGDADAGSGDPAADRERGVPVRQTGGLGPHGPVDAGGVHPDRLRASGG